MFSAKPEHKSNVMNNKSKKYGFNKTTDELFINMSHNISKLSYNITALDPRTIRLTKNILKINPPLRSTETLLKFPLVILSHSVKKTVFH